mmetsp:Transcript_3320/g.8683  ORF Transcript_3320/g.8683 Transcript_3320/m.8683 type:complete len:100 (+) Transcript_3320:326-625(+)
MSARTRDNVIKAETKRFVAVLSHPAFQTDPFKTIEVHIANALQANDSNSSPGGGREPADRKSADNYSSGTRPPSRGRGGSHGRGRPRGSLRGGRSSSGR